MAKFLVRLQTYVTGAASVPTASKDYFTDDNGDSGEGDLNILAEEGVFLGDGAGNVNPGANITRRQMANVLVRKFQVMFENGDIHNLFVEAGAVSGTVTSVSGSNPIVFDTDAGVSKTANLAADTDTTDTFFIDGAAATEAAFVAAASPGDRIQLTDTDADGNYDIHRLTNNPAPTSGLVGAVELDSSMLSIITNANTPLNTFTFGDASDSYTVDGVSVSQTGFEAALSIGDTVNTTDTSPATPDGDPETYALDERFRDRYGCEPHAYCGCFGHVHCGCPRR